MKCERRNRNRFPFVQVELEGDLSLHVDGSVVGICELQDISPFGLGLMIETDITNGKVVSLRYRRADIDIEVTGIVAWSLSAEADHTLGCRVGISFQDADMNPNVEFFNAITS